VKNIEVKTIVSVFNDVWAGKKYSELRIDDDKDYRIDDNLTQREWMVNKMEFTGRTVTMRICGITRVNRWIDGVDDRWVILHLKPDTFWKGQDKIGI